MAPVDRSRGGVDHEQTEGSIDNQPAAGDRNRPGHQSAPRRESQPAGLDELQAYREARARAEQSQANRPRSGAGRPESEQSPTDDKHTPRSANPPADRGTANLADEVRRLIEYRDRRAQQLEHLERRRFAAYQDEVRQARARPDAEASAQGETVHPEADTIHPSSSAAPPGTERRSKRPTEASGAGDRTLEATGDGGESAVTSPLSGTGTPKPTNGPDHARRTPVPEPEGDQTGPSRADETKRQSGTAMKPNVERGPDLPAAERYGGDVVRHKNNDPAAVRLASRIGGEPSAGFDSDPDRREFDVISDLYIAQAKPASLTHGSRFRNQARATFEACVATNRTPYFYFEGEPGRDVLRKLGDYERRYGIRAIVDIKSLGD